MLENGLDRKDANCVIVVALFGNEAASARCAPDEELSVGEVR